MNELALIKSEHFGEVEADIYSNGDDVFMTISQLANCLGYSGRDGVEKILKRNPYLDSPEFSVTDKLSAADGKFYETRIFTEDGIYEVTMLSKQPKARQFRAWVRKILKNLRTGKIKPMTAYQEKKVATMERNSRIQAAKLLNQIAANYEGTSYQQVLQAHATKELTGDFLLPLPKLEAKTYSAKEVGDILGISAHRVGALANQHGLKNDQYGQWFKDKSPYGNKEVSTFRYYASAVEKMREVLARN